MKDRTIAVKLHDDQAEAFQVAAARRGLTISAAIAAILRQATNDFQDFAILDGVKQPKRGRAGKPKAAEELSSYFANGENITDLMGRFERPRKRRAS